MKEFEPIEAYDTGYLQVDEIHSIYYEQSGNPNGKPIVFLHGGPGGNTEPKHRQLFDPVVYRIILFDQRGAGKSKPFACFENNTTDHLVDDIDRLRKHLGIEKWAIFGGSWGTTLALLYAIKYSQYVVGLVLRGIFLARKEDSDWLFERGASDIYPDIFEPYRDFVGAKEGESICEKYYEIFCGEDEELKNRAAYYWNNWEYRIVSVHPKEEQPEISLPHAFFECHYAVNDFFLEENYILNNVCKIAHKPIYIVHGRLDMDCKLEMAWALHKKLNNSKLHIVEVAGHTMEDANMKEILMQCVEELKELQW